ncbi:hypothetical protein C8R44DRAFT_818367 [Mycena epipterygia]|nr:hypothetical protein C8R44DRAFT_818367 [Mycena epipterygia]
MERKQMSMLFFLSPHLPQLFSTPNHTSNHFIPVVNSAATMWRAQGFIRRDFWSRPLQPPAFSLSAQSYRCRGMPPCRSLRVNTAGAADDGIQAATACDENSDTRVLRRFRVVAL